MPKKAQKPVQATYFKRKWRKKKNPVSLYLTGFYEGGR